MKRALWLWCELLCVYVAVPFLMFKRVLPNWPIPFLLLGTTGALLVLRSDKSFIPQVLVLYTDIGRGFRKMLLVDGPLLLLLGLAVRIFTPQMLFSFVKTMPRLWLLVMILYPVFSVYPQELLYRAYFFHRFKPILGSGPAMVGASALLFGYVHIIFGNWIAVALTAFGGFLFGMTYRKSSSLVLVCLEHALFGDFIFTIGIGKFFYHLAHH